MRVVGATPSSSKTPGRSGARHSLHSPKLTTPVRIVSTRTEGEGLLSVSPRRRPILVAGTGGTSIRRRPTWRAALCAATVFRPGVRETRTLRTPRPSGNPGTRRRRVCVWEHDANKGVIVPEIHPPTTALSGQKGTYTFSPRVEGIIGPAAHLFD